MNNKRILILFVLMFTFSLRTLYLVLTKQIGELENWRVSFSIIGFLFFTALLTFKVWQMKKK